MARKRVPADDILQAAKDLGLLDTLKKLVKQGEKLDDITVDKLRAAAKKVDDDINWSPTSRPTFGHTFSRHGAGGRNTQNLLGRARSTGEPQGQWLDNDRAAEFLRDSHVPGGGTRTVAVPPGLGQVIRPDGTIVPASQATLVPRPGGVYRTAYPVEG